MMTELDSLSDGHGVTRDGDDLVIETPYGDARLSLADANEAANDQPRTPQNWTDLPEKDRWRILGAEVRLTLVETRSEGLL